MNLTAFFRTLVIEPDHILPDPILPCQAMLDDEHLLNGLNVHDGKVTYKAVADVLGYDYVPAATALG